MSMLEDLKRIKENPVPPLGICDQLRFVSETDKLWPRFRRWPLFSGSTPYPVPHPTLPPNVAFTDATINGTMWADTPYGNNRRALLQYLIDELELKSILEQIPADYSSKYGTCNFIGNHDPYLVELFLNLAERWPDKSGNRTCPVPSPDPDYSASEYYFYTPNYNIWDRNTPYGASRWALVEFVKEILQ